MIRFNSDNLIVGEIKQLLKTFNLPCCKVFTPGMFIIKDEYYIHYPYLYKSKETKFIDNFDDNSFEKINLYRYGEKIPGLTKNYALDSLIYDTHIHRYLGDYLRFYSDFYRINLMSMYNCFSEEMASSVYFGKSLEDSWANVSYSDESGEGPASVIWDAEDERGVQVKTTIITIDHEKSFKTNSKIYAVPVKLFKEYTIGIDCDKSVELMLDFYNRDFEITVINEDVMKELHNYSYQIVRSCRFNKPFLFTKSLFNDGYFSNDVLEEFAKQEDSFRLLIKIPNSCTSSISVVEGDYVKNCNYLFSSQTDGNIKLLLPKVVDGESGERLSEETKYITKLELFRINSKVQHPFATRLIEYLTDNVISNADTISKDIERVQLSLYHPIEINGKYVRRLPLIKYKGLWQDDIKDAIFKDCLREDLIDKYYDLLYYVDKDVEADIIKEASDNGGEQ